MLYFESIIENLKHSNMLSLLVTLMQFDQFKEFRGYQKAQLTGQLQVVQVVYSKLHQPIKRVFFSTFPVIILLLYLS